MEGRGELKRWRQVNLSTSGPTLRSVGGDGADSGPAWHTKTRPCVTVGPGSVRRGREMARQK
jgi:hypothetical protein